MAKELELGEQLLEYAGDIPADELQRISRSRNVLAAVLEAAIAALYLEHGFEQIEPAIVAAFAEKIEYARSSHVDYKTELQEALARSGKQVHYTVLEVEGPPHDRRFVCAAHVAGVQLGVGQRLDEEGGRAGGRDAGARRARRRSRAVLARRGTDSGTALRRASAKLGEALGDDVRVRQLRFRACVHERENRCGKGCPERADLRVRRRGHPPIEPASVRKGRRSHAPAPRAALG